MSVCLSPRFYPHSSGPAGPLLDGVPRFGGAAAILAAISRIKTQNAVCPMATVVLYVDASQCPPFPRRKCYNRLENFPGDFLACPFSGRGSPRAAVCIRIEEYSAPARVSFRNQFVASSMLSARHPSLGGHRLGGIPQRFVDLSAHPQPMQ